jgi:large subunit ribosomal protein L4
MVDVPVYNESGDQVETMTVDETLLGTRVRPALLKQAAVMYLANQRLGTSATRSRGMVVGSTRKLFRQKGTGNARMGTIRTNIRRGGGVAFAKQARDFRQAMPKKMRRLACKNAILAKILGGNLLVIDQLQYDQPKTKRFAAMLQALKSAKGCLVAIPEQNDNVYKSGRNIPKTEIRLVEQLNAYEILRRRHMLTTKEGLAQILRGPEQAEASGEGAN